MKIHQGKQGTDNWHELRLNRVGGSECAPLLVKPSEGNLLGSGALTLLDKKMAEFQTGLAADNFVSADMEKGSEIEPDIIKAYEKREFVKVQPIQYVEDGPLFGFSPDGFVGDDGLIECKYKKPHVFAKYVRTGVIEKSHIAQMQWGMLKTGRAWCDYTVFNPLFQKPLIVVRIQRDEEMIDLFRGAKKRYEQEWDRNLGFYE